MGKPRDVEVMALEIGGKIKELRLKKGFTLKDLSTLTGLSKPLISQIENNRVVPPVATLLKLARALDVGLGFFFQESESRDRVVITRKTERRSIARPHHRKTGVGYSYQSLEVKRTEKHMEPFWVTFDLNVPEEMVFYSHEGEEFVYLFEGELEFRTRDQNFVLQEGDCLYFDSEIPHAFRSLSPTPTQALIVIYHKD